MGNILNGYDSVAFDIITCGMHKDLCCLANDELFAKVMMWREQFGISGLKKLIDLACKCNVQPTPPAPTPTPPSPPPPSPPPPPNPPTPPIASCDIPGSADITKIVPQTPV